MLVLGLILILLSADSLVAVLSSGTDDHAQLFGGAIDVSTLVVFLAGAAALLVFIMGLELVRSGVRRANQNRKTKKKLRTLEKREEQRADTPVTGRADSPTGSPTGTATTAGTADTADTADTAETAATTPTAPGGTATAETAHGGPYETPPPPSR